MQRIARGSPFALLLLTLAAAAAAEHSDQACSMDRMETDPASVIAPCTARLEKTDLTPGQRAAAYFVRGRGHHRTGRADLAAEDYDDALALAPNNDEIYVDRANAAFQQNAHGLGEAFLRAALRINPKNAHAMRTMGVLNGDFEKYDEALSWYARALDVDPTEPFALLFRSEIHARRQNYTRAFRDADALVAISPDVINRQGLLDWRGRQRDFHVLALTHRAGLYEATARYDLARRDLDAAVDYKYSPGALLARGEFLSRRGGMDEAALNDLDNATALDPEYPHAHNLRGFVLVQLRRWELALRSFDRTLALDPDNAYALSMRAHVYRELDQTEEAVRDMEAAMLIDQDVVRETMPALLHAGYWASVEPPPAFTPAFRDAIRACMLDKTCN